MLLWFTSSLGEELIQESFVTLRSSSSGPEVNPQSYFPTLECAVIKDKCRNWHNAHISYLTHGMRS